MMLAISHRYNRLRRLKKRLPLKEQPPRERLRRRPRLKPQ
jgi:hypothetical protein